MPRAGRHILRGKEEGLGHANSIFSLYPNQIDQYFSFKIIIKVECLLEFSTFEFFKYFIRKIFKHKV